MKMKNYEFEKLLEDAELTNVSFAEITGMKRGSISNWKNKNNKSKGESHFPKWVESWLINYIKAKRLDEIENKNEVPKKEIYVDKEYIDILMKSASLSLTEFCKEIGYSQSGFNKWKRNNTFPLWVEGWLKGYIALNGLGEFIKSFDYLKSVHINLNDDYKS